MPYNGKQQKYGISAGFLETRGMREKEKKNKPCRFGVHE
jgi:hypothetical protein